MQLFTDQTIQAIYRTLLDSLWLGMLLAMVSAVAILITKKASSAARYNVLLILLSLFLGSIGFSFSHHWQSANERGTAQAHFYSPSPKAAAVSFSTPGNLTPVVKEKKFLDTLGNYLNANASLLVTIWFFVLSAHCIKLLANIGYIQRIRYQKTHAPSEFWEIRILELADMLQISKPVELLESEIVRIPMVIGLLKPVILFPFSLLSQLPSSQIEAILLHELAHIKRNDYLVNLVQSFSEILFFFNPAVLWVSSMIREERENCCDDIVVGETHSRNELIQALVSFQEFNLSPSKYVTAFPGRKNYLLERIKRILTHNNKTLNHMEKISLVTGIVIASLVLIGFTQKINRQLVTDTGQTKKSITDTIPQKEKTRDEESSPRGQYNIEGKNYRIIQKKDQVIGLYVDGKKVPDKDLEKFKSIIEKIKRDEKENQAKMKMQQMKLRMEEESLTMKQRELNSQMAQLNEELAKNQKVRADISMQLIQEPHEIQQEEMNLKLDLLKKEQDIRAEDQERAYLALKLSQLGNDLDKKTRMDAWLADKAYQRQLESQMEQLKISLDLLAKIKTENLSGQFNKDEADFKKQKELIDLKENLLRIKLLQDLKMQSNDQKLEISKQKTELDQLQVQNQNPGSPFLSVDPGALAVPKMALTQSKPIGSIIDDLIQEKIVKQNEDLSFTLNNEILEVNGVQQPAELHKKMKGKYLKSSNDHVIYSVSKGSTHADVLLAADK